MLKKSMQNILLTVSVLVACILVGQIWFGSYLSPTGGEGLFSGIGKNILNPIIEFFDGRREADFSENLQKLYKPDKIVLNNAGSRLVFSAESESFNDVRAMAEGVLRDGILGTYGVKSHETVDEETFLSVLKGRSIYVDYGRNCDFRLFSYGVSGQEKNRLTEGVSEIRSYVISLQDGILNDVSLYLRDEKSGAVYRYVLEADKTELSNQMESYLAQGASSAASYSFELNFHKEQEEAVSKALFDPLLLLDLAPTQLPKAESLKENRAEQLQSDNTEEAILDAFSINNRTLRKYTDLNDARVFVENNATLTIYPDGLLVYQTVPGGRGLDISGGAEKTNYNIYAATADAVRFVENVCNRLYPELFNSLEISSHLIEDENTPGYYRICFDYCISGVPVRQKLSTGFGHTIEIEIENGYLKSYRQFFKNYEVQETLEQLTPMLNVADLLVDAMYTGEKPLMINAISPCYIETKDGAMTFAWQTVVDGQETILE